MNVPQAIIFLSQFIKLYVVGGAVRDWCMGVAPKDWDLATPLTPQQVGEVVAGLNEGERGPRIRLYYTGFDHGTVTLSIEGEDYEVTTFRSDHNCDGRHANVEFVADIESDLARRDFTINAMAYDLSLHEELMWANAPDYSACTRPLTGPFDSSSLTIIGGSSLGCHGLPFPTYV